MVVTGAACAGFCGNCCKSRFKELERDVVGVIL
jgi:hypothetical protein